MLYVNMFQINSTTAFSLVLNNTYRQWVMSRTSQLLDSITIVRVVKSSGLTALRDEQNNGETHLSVHSRGFTGHHREWVWDYNIRWVYIGFPDGFFILFKDADLSVSQWGFHTPSLTNTHVGTIITKTFHWHYWFCSELMALQPS